MHHNPDPCLVNTFETRLHQLGRAPLRRTTITTLQINLGKRCNQTCQHCHVNAGPARTEMMTRQTADRILDWLAHTTIPTVDLTGGAPELNPNFRYLVESCRTLRRHVIDRCNLTVLFEPGQHDLAEFLADNRVEIIASLPCYLPNNVDAQRGDGVFDKSIRALQILNALGYGTAPDLPLNLVYNPLGDTLPPQQAQLEADYRHHLRAHYGIVFNHLYTLTNMPIARFAAWLHREGRYDSYLQLLIAKFNPATLDHLMCRTTLSIGWRGEVYDCDFNQMLDLRWCNHQPLYLWDITVADTENRPIITGPHCFGCTAGCGSSCTGALTS
ncbi:MAG: arsenosugar biosynthesis radical SAM protein ArsS [Verrucomicrobiae bacterium]|nr:arsenosugar biosynthesis radical SAM protein ArsS [Verrucomicrobiae bacterium]